MGADPCNEVGSEVIALVLVDDSSSLFVEVERTVVMDIGGAELTTRELGAAPVP